MKVYRIKHIPTGMYFSPSRHVKVWNKEKTTYSYVKSNLSDKGKIYHSMPSLSWTSTIYDHTRVVFIQDGRFTRTAPNSHLIRTEPTDWLIEEL